MPPLPYQVIPLRRVPSSLGVLDYVLPNTSRKPVLGEFVRIPFGASTLQGIVYRAGASHTQKHFIPKPLHLEQQPKFLTPEQMTLLTWLHTETLTPLPVIACGLLPANRYKKSATPKAVQPKAVLAAHLEEREKIIAQFAQQKSLTGSTVVIIPAQSYAQAWLDAFGSRAMLVHGKLSDKAKQHVLDQQPKLIVTTHVGVLLPYAKVTHVIIDQADDDGYFAFDQAPRVDMRACARELAHCHGAALTLIARWQSPTLQGLFPLAQWRGKTVYPWVVVDRTGEAGEQRRAIVAASLQDRVRHGRTLWLVHRRGEAGHLRCQDCGQGVMCPTCKHPLQVIKKGSLSTLFCPQDNMRMLYPETCTNCKSANLTLQGKGVSAIAQALRKELQQPVTHMDARTPLEQPNVQHVVATTAIANYPEQRFDRVVIVRAENFFATGHYRGTEEFTGTLALARQHGRVGAEVICQTFSPQAVELHDMPAAIAQESKDRKLANYPPFGVLVVLQPRVRVARQSTKPFALDIGFPVQPLGKGKYFVRAAQAQRATLLRVILRQLHDSWEAIVDPPRIPND